MELYERMKAIQTDSDEKVRELAAQFGVSEHCLGNYLNGKRTVPYDVLVQFARHYHVTADYLLGLAESPSPARSSISPEEETFLEQFRALTREQKELIVQSIELMEKQNRRG